MAPLNFPSNPGIGTVYTDLTSGFSYEWDGNLWKNYAAASSSQIKILDDISGSFNGSNTTFALTSNTYAIAANVNPASLIINLGDVVQSPGIDYYISGTNIVFTTAPTNGLSFSGVSLGPAIPVNTILDGTVTPAKLSTGGPYWDTSGNLSVTGVTTTSSAVVGSAVTINSSGIRVSGIVTTNNVIVGGSTTALVVNGDTRITGILTVGSGSITINGSSNSISGISTVYTSALNGGQLGGSRNMIINGSMVVNQRGWTGAAGTSVSNAYTTDRFRIEFIHDGAVSAGQTTLTSGNAYADGFQNAHILRVTTADSSLSAGQYQLISQYIEGYNVQGIKKGTANALPVTLSFWVRSTTTGTYIIELQDNDNTRQCSKSYTIDAANTWEKKTLTFPADTTGVFDNDNNLSLALNWWLAAGSTYSGGTLNTSWAGITTANRASGQVNALGTVGDFWLTGVQFEVGSTASEFERRSYGDELRLCQRYFISNLLAYQRTYIASGGYAGVSVTLPTTMRANPTLTQTSTSNVNLAANALDVASTSSVYVYAAGISIGNATLSSTFNASIEL